MVEQENQSKDPLSNELVSKVVSSEPVIKEVTDEPIDLTTILCDHHLNESSESVSRLCPHPFMETKAVHSKITEEEITKAIKRVEQLGYSISSKYQCQTKTDEVTKHDIIYPDCEKIPEKLHVDIVQEIWTLFSQISSLISQLSYTAHKVTALDDQKQTYINHRIKQTIALLTTQLQTIQGSAHNSSEIISSTTTADQASVAMATQSLDLSVLSLLEHYSDKLVNIVKDKELRC